MSKYVLKMLRAPLLAGLVLGSLVLGAFGAFAEVPSSETPGELKAAIKAAVEAQGKTYAGFCREIEQNQHVGEWCAFVLTLTDTKAEVTLGPVATNEVQKVTFSKSGSAWVIGNDIHSSAVPAELKAAIKAAVEARGKTYAGFCREIEQNQHVGQWCAFVLTLTDTKAEVTIGSVATNESHSLTFTKSGSTWRIPGTGVTIAPPSTGSAGLAGRSFD